MSFMFSKRAHATGELKDVKEYFGREDGDGGQRVATGSDRAHRKLKS
ncbi:hypothetical protein EWM64_g6921 [Hericium alpestre]|uniref:Uncharacterized protein n=1 Tax=Hericium alpestre TaxID=135208 RepID=A0A4Y9ZSS7_9AGAM|nr:hypothetical protein EWM64_g6921 [Hericium alpestre]